jgi:hypothetical protein
MNNSSQRLQYMKFEEINEKFEGKLQGISAKKEMANLGI